MSMARCVNGLVFRTVSLGFDDRFTIEWLGEPLDFQLLGT
jgi:hypothetical protein